MICSRSEEYSAIGNTLSMAGAIIIQPLTSAQVDSYFDRFGNIFASVRVLLTKDQILRELAVTPLLLTILALAYKDTKPEEVIIYSSVEDKRKHLFNTYVEQMLDRPTRPTSPPFTKQGTLYGLSWLARTMIRYDITAVQIEIMQPRWLETQSQIRFFRFYTRLTFGLIWGLIFGLLFLDWFWGLMFGLLGMIVITPSKKIDMIDKLRWSWKAGRVSIEAMVMIGLYLGLMVGLDDGWKGWLEIGLGARLMFGLVGGLVAGLISRLMSGLRTLQVEETSTPGQRLKHTLFSAFVVLMAYILLLGLIISPVLSGAGEPLMAIRFGIITGIFVWLILGEKYGVTSLIQHYSLRKVLQQYQLLPWHLIPFLDYAVDLIFLRRVGGSYIFVHRLLMEHFAEMEIQPDRQERGSSNG